MKLPRFPATFALLLLLVSAPFVFPDVDPAAGRKACVFPMDDVSDSRDYGDFRAILTNTVTQELQDAGFEIQPAGAWKEQLDAKKLTESDLAEGRVAMEVASAAGADMAVSGFYAADGKRVLVSLEFYDALGNRPIAGFMKSLPLNIGFYNDFRDEIAGLVPGLRFASGKPLTVAAGAAKVRLGKVAFLSPNEGMEVRLAGGQSIGTISGGRLEYDLGEVGAGTALLVEKSLAGYHPGRETVRAGSEMHLAPLVRASNYGLQLDWTMGQLVGLGAAFRWYTVPDTVFTSLGTYLHAQLPLTSTGHTVLHDDTGILVGAYLSPPEAGVRFGVSAGMGVVLSLLTQAGFPFYTDFYVSPLNAWIEWKLGGARMSFGIQGKYALGILTNLLGRGWMFWEQFPPVNLGVSFSW